MLHNRTSKRIGFTLVELLVVIAIIAILAGLGMWGIFAMIGRSQGRNTESTMKVVNKLLMARWSAVISDAKKESISQATHPNVFALASNDLERARVIWVKVRLMEAFPMSYGEVQTPTVLTFYIPGGKQKPHFAKYQTLVGATPSGGAGESSACLLMALNTLSPDGVSVQDQLGPAVADTDGDGLKELIDGWTKPMVFTRFGTDANVQKANPASPTSTAFKYSDPTDPGGKLVTPSWYSANAATFGTQFHAISNDNGAHANYVIPVIVANVPTGPVYSYNLRGD